MRFLTLIVLIGSVVQLEATKRRARYDVRKSHRSADKNKRTHKEQIKIRKHFRWAGMKPPVETYLSVVERDAAELMSKAYKARYAADLAKELIAEEAFQAKLKKDKEAGLPPPYKWEPMSDPVAYAKKLNPESGYRPYLASAPLYPATLSATITAFTAILTGLVIGSGVTFAVIRYHRTSTASKEPLLTAYN